MKTLNEIQEIEIEGNVLSFINESSKRCANHIESSFRGEMHCFLIERGISSPIEQLFYVAFMEMCIVDCIKISEGPLDNLVFDSGIEILPQYKVGKYKCDFLIQNHSPYRKIKQKQVIVELDGHNFHDKNAKQRSYEKSRDRYLNGAGYTVLHFTGSDVCKNPLNVAREVYSFIDQDFFDGGIL